MKALLILAHSTAISTAQTMLPKQTEGPHAMTLTNQHRAVKLKISSCDTATMPRLLPRHPPNRHTALLGIKAAATYLCHGCQSAAFEQLPLHKLDCCHCRCPARHFTSHYALHHSSATLPPTAGQTQQQWQWGRWRAGKNIARLNTNTDVYIIACLAGAAACPTEAVLLAMQTAVGSTEGAAMPARPLSVILRPVCSSSG